MRLPYLVATSAFLVTAASSAAHAGFTVGATLGMTQAEADSNDDANNTMGLYGRVGILPRLAAQLDLNRITSGDTSNTTDLRQATALAVLDLGGHNFVPILLAGAGLDWQSDNYSSSNYHHLEVGVGFEYRAIGGFVVGIDARLGTRTLDSSSESYTSPPTAYAHVADAAPDLSEGEYRSVRLTAGFSF
jgi:hypothetical protein